MRICYVKATNKLIEMQSNATEGTLINNAVRSGYSIDDIEEVAITMQQWVDVWSPEPVKSLNLDELDAWLITDETIKPYVSFFPIISRATQKDTPTGYQLMQLVALSEDYNIPEQVVSLVIDKLRDLGANVD